jgi:hypothetical protein
VALCQSMGARACMRATSVRSQFVIGHVAERHYEHVRMVCLAGPAGLLTFLVLASSWRTRPAKMPSSRN